MRSAAPDLAAHAEVLASNARLLAAMQQVIVAMNEVVVAMRLASSSPPRPPPAKPRERR
jgi:hypothetical protein